MPKTIHEIQLEFNDAIIDLALILEREQIIIRSSAVETEARIQLSTIAKKYGANIEYDSPYLLQSCFSVVRGKMERLRDEM